MAAILYLSGIILAFFLSFLLFTKKNKSRADTVLVVWLAVIGCHLLGFYLQYSGQHLRYPGWIALGFPLPLAHGPFLYLYTRLQTSSRRFKLKDLLHFVPVMLSYAMFSAFYFLPLAQQAEVFRQKGAGYETQMMVNLYAIYVSGVVYVTVSLITLLSYRRKLVDRFSNTEKINFNWLLYLIIWMVAIWTVVLFTGEDKLIFGTAALFVLWIGYFSIKQVKVFEHETPEPVADISQTINYDDETNTTSENIIVENNVTVKYQKSTLSDRDAALIHERLNKLMSEQKPYINPDLTLTELAKYLNVHPNTLSQVINTREKKNFYDLVNAKRVEEFINRVSQPASEQFTLLGIASDCGFNSKASFNRNFKKYVGFTPSDYVKQLAK